MITSVRDKFSPQMVRRNKRWLRLALAIAVSTTPATFSRIAFAQAPVESLRPDGEPSQISDWAYAGLLWSNASLTKKAALQALRESSDDQTGEKYKAIVVRSQKVINELESFGWKQVRQEAGAVDQAAATNAAPTRAAMPSINPRETGDPSPVSDSAVEPKLPDPTDVGRDIASSLGSGPAPVPPQVARQRAMQNRRTAAVDSRLKRFDTETPAGMDDPGMDDERVGERSELDIDQYRVDDYIDETAVEARNMTDAIEDGVEGAIAAANPDAIAGPTANHISRREGWTLSNTLPYSKDSIYDADDFDPDVDYRVDNPLGVRSANPSSVAIGDGDDDIAPEGVAKPRRFEMIDGEDELLADMIREGERGPIAEARYVKRKPALSNMTGRAPNRTAIGRFTPSENLLSKDADWVQLHLEANQMQWNEIQRRGVDQQAVAQCIERLKLTAALTAKSSQSPALQQLVRKLILTQ